MNEILSMLQAIIIFNLGALVALSIASVIIYKAAKNASPYPENWDDNELSKEVHRRIFDNHSNL